MTEVRDEESYRVPRRHRPWRSSSLLWLGAVAVVTAGFVALLLARSDGPAPSLPSALEIGTGTARTIRTTATAVTGTTNRSAASARPVVTSTTTSAPPVTAAPVRASTSDRPARAVAATAPSTTRPRSPTSLAPSQRSQAGYSRVTVVTPRQPVTDDAGGSDGDPTTSATPTGSGTGSDN
ncbi:MAG TPA: hypothetical protein VND23_03535 [Acidimicrobiales bacterium]|nr:hypothetical protein [Acidimicrobiales bacterium]